MTVSGPGDSVLASIVGEKEQVLSKPLRGAHWHLTARSLSGEQVNVSQKHSFMMGQGVPSLASFLKAQNETLTWP